MARELQALLRQIPCGEVTTYGTLATALGDIAASRWVGTWIADHPHDSDCGCHRVVRADGSVGTFAAGDEDQKVSRLRAEGVCVHNRRVTLSGRFANFTTRPCLQPLAQWQRQQVPRFVIRDDFAPVRTVGGIDLSYGSEPECTAALVVLDYQDLEVRQVTTVTSQVHFPYIPGYLSFRELPVLLELLRDAPRRPDVLLVDGAGALHPRRCGLACLVGLIADIPTIGVAKSHLIGTAGPGMPDGHPEEGQLRIVEVDGRQRGGVFLPLNGRRGRLYVSPGHRVGLRSSLQIVRRTLGPGRWPLPIRWADRISRRPALAPPLR